MQKKKQGISLIVLVITIIVMIILAATIIISLSNNGVINNAKDAVDKTNEKQVQEIANLAWGEAYADGKREVSDLRAAVDNALKANNITLEDCTVYVTAKGVEILKGKGWIQTSDRHVVKGSTVLSIGDYVDYKSNVSGYTDTNGWKVLGAENGELLIMSTSNITNSSYIYQGSLSLGSMDTVDKAINDCKTGISKLNEICTPYGRGTYALGARSITAEDVYRVTGHVEKAYNVITYKYNGTSGLEYESSDGRKQGTWSSVSRYGLNWYDEEQQCWRKLTASDLTNAENTGKEIMKLTLTACYRDVDKATTNLAKGTDAYNMLFGNDNLSYWLASRYVNYYSYNCEPLFGMKYVALGSVTGMHFFRQQSWR